MFNQPSSRDTSLHAYCSKDFVESMTRLFHFSCMMASLPKNHVFIKNAYVFVVVKLMSRDMMFASSVDRSTAKVKEEKPMYVGMKDETLHFCKPLPCLHFI